ncbi:hypothetical protein BaRGS_00033944 [Batillaria attramentaria]|uniref:Uncharacterized protein n=1 Tax=Batillaria attramentaria TaxID=370345 RepID=A0ABD0JIS5_9CAEN
MALPELPVQTATLTSDQILRQLNVIVRPPPPAQDPRYSVEEQSGTDGDVNVNHPPNGLVQQPNNFGQASSHGNRNGN